MNVKQWLSLFAVLSSILLLAACGSNSGSGGDQSAAPAADDKGTDPATGIEYVGTEKCIGCHDDISWSTDIVDAYLMGKHVIHSDHITAADEAEGCLDCHDPIGDGAALEAFIDAADVPTEGLAAVGCESCHGAGGDHYGVGPMPVAKPDYTACASCHGELPESHLTFHPEANNITADYLSSPHAHSINEHTYVDGSDSDVRARCSKCHTDEGAELYKHIQGDSDVLHSLDGNPAVGNATPVQCRTCHNAHNTQELLLGDIEDGDGVVTESAEFRTCTNCHQTETAYHDPATNPYGDLGEIITDTHFDDPDTPDVIEGYNMDTASERTCRDCHNVHSAEVAINEQWAASGHANGLSWADHDWDSTTEYDDGVVDDNGECQMCHTATGAMNYLNDPAAYDPLDNDFSYLDGWSLDGGANGETVSSGQNEMLYCWGCHSDNSGALRAPGAINPDYVATSGTEDAIFPDVAGSNVCLACHAGRESGGNIKASDDNFTAKRFVNSHYLPAGGTLYKTVGYEYADAPDYNSHGHFQHDLIGAEEGQNGACVGCHMESKEGHTFSVVEKDDTGSITAITATSCVGCHDGGHGPAFVAEGGDPDAVLAAANVLNEEVESFEASIHALAAQLYNAGFPYQGGYPYFGTFAQREVDWTSGGTYDGKNAMGAAFNFNYLHHEPGAYAHNRVYTKKLIFDSIDYLDDATINASVGATLDSLVGTYLDADEVDTLTQEDVDLAKVYLDGDDEVAGVQRPE